METQQLLEGLFKLHERLTIILDYNIDSKIETSEEDTLLIKELVDWLYRSNLSWANKTEILRHKVTQESLFNDKKS